jgi:hypothetical protein
MKNCDIIQQICVYNDYPILRHLLNAKWKFDQVILFPSRHHGKIDCEEFLKSNIKATWVTRPPIDYGVEDWRQAECIPCLPHSKSSWLWFSEQDFFVDDWEEFFAYIEEQMKTADLIGWWHDSAFPYIHPCCMFIKREMLDKTNKDFRAHPETIGSDHFAMITRDVERLGGKIVKIQDDGWTNWERAFHMAGLTYPYQNFDGDNTIFGVGNVESFYVYNKLARQAPIVQDPQWLDLSIEVEKVLDKLHPEFKDIDIFNCKWTKFFKLWESK